MTTEIEELQAERVALGLHPQNGGRSIADRASDPIPPSEDDDVFEDQFPLGVLDGDERITLKNLIRAGEPVEVTASLMTAEVPLRGGLVDPRRDGKVVVSFEAAKYIPVPQREGEPGDKTLVGWKVRCQLRPTYVEPATGYFSREQVLDLLTQLGLPRTADAVVALLGEGSD